MRSLGQKTLIVLLAFGAMTQSSFASSQDNDVNARIVEGFLEGVSGNDFVHRLKEYSAKASATVFAPGERSGVLISATQIPAAGRLLRRPVGGGDFQSCSGAMISRRHFLTAAHCVCESRGDRDYFKTEPECVKGKAPEAKNSYVILPSTGLLDTTGVIHIAKNYNITSPLRNAPSGSLLGDLAIIELTEEVSIEPITLGELESGKRLASVGFGTFSMTVEGARALDVAPGPYREGLSVVSFPTMAVCLPKHRDAVCADYAFFAQGAQSGRVAVCPGDSGGPLVQVSADGKVTLVGVTSARTSFQKECVEEDAVQSIFTSVYQHMQWLQQITRDQNPPQAKHHCQEYALKPPNSGQGIIDIPFNSNKNVPLSVMISAVSLSMGSNKPIQVSAEAAPECQNILGRSDMIMCRPVGSGFVTVKAEGDGLVQVSICALRPVKQ